MLSANLTAACQPPGKSVKLFVFAYENKFPRRIIARHCDRTGLRSGANPKAFAKFRGASAYYPNNFADSPADPSIAAAHLSTTFAKH